MAATRANVQQKAEEVNKWDHVLELTELWAVDMIFYYKLELSMNYSEWDWTGMQLEFNWIIFTLLNLECFCLKYLEVTLL